MKLTSCDTFVVLPPSSGSSGSVFFGKNSDRPNGEVSELIHETGRQYPVGSKLQCTYIEVDQVSSTYNVILSKPAWMWGAEMGANDQGVVIGNEAVWTKVQDDGHKKLLGMDLVRLALERSKDANEAVNCITELLERYGQGGPCSDIINDLTYHNSYLIVDCRGAWVLETAGQLWAAEKITTGCRNISNGLTIGFKMDATCSDLKVKAQQLGLWDGEEEFHFANVFSSGSNPSRWQDGKTLVEDLTADNTFDVLKMFRVLRDSESGICRGCDDSFPTTSSQVSMLAPSGSRKPDCHWFTATPDPRISVFKPFIFSPSPRLSIMTRSPQDKSDRSHVLYKMHRAATTGPNQESVLALLRNMELNCVGEVDKFLADYKVDQDLSEVDDLLKDVVETEVKFYK